MSKKLTKDNLSDESCNNKKAGRPTKRLMFKDERDEIVCKINNIIGISEDNGHIYLDEFTEDKKQEILLLVNDVKKYFNYTCWQFFLKSEEERSCLSLIKNIYKDMNYNVRQYTEQKKVNKIATKRTLLIIYKK